MNTVGAFALFFQQENILAIDGSFIFIVILFILLVVLMNKMVFQPLLNTLADRDRLTVGATGDASSIMDDYNKRLTHYENSLRQARAEAYIQLEEKRRHALNERAQVIEKAKGNVAAEIDKAKADVGKQVADAKQNLAGDAQRLAAQISTAILKRPVGGANN